MLIRGFRLRLQHPRVDRPRGAVSPLGGQKRNKNMIDVIPASPDALDTWLVDSGGHIAVSNAGLTLLEPELSPGPSELSEMTGPLREV
jgi:hypothetical protein